MRSTLFQILQVLHHWVAVVYLTIRGSFCHGWYEALEHAPAPLEDIKCPVKQLIGISVHDKAQ